MSRAGVGKKEKKSEGREIRGLDNGILRFNFPLSLALFFFCLILIMFAIVTTTIMQSIGDSLARSFGIFGALAIIRFRSRISNPRDVGFVFATMAVGIACGVHSFINGIVGTVLFCLVVIILRFTPFSQKQSLVGTLRFDVPEDSNDTVAVQALVKQYSRTFSLKGYRIFFDNEKI